MKLTDSAVNAILEVMLKKELNPKTIFLEVGIFDGNLGLGFTRDKKGKTLKFGSLIVIVSNNVDSTGVVIDFGEYEGRKGLIFLGENNGIRE